MKMLPRLLNFVNRTKKCRFFLVERREYHSTPNKKRVPEEREPEAKRWTPPFKRGVVIAGQATQDGNKAQHKNT
jgi:hypothetical protein